MFASSSSCSSWDSCVSSSCVSPSSVKMKAQPIAYRSWEECDTLAKKVAFIVVKAFAFASKVTGKVLDGAVWMCKQITKAARVCFRAFNWVAGKLTTAISKVGNIALNGIKTLYQTKLSQAVINSICKLSKAAYSRADSCARFIGNKILTACKTIKKLADRTIIPFNDHVLTPIGRFTMDKIKQSINFAFKVAKKLANSIVPLYNNVSKYISGKIRSQRNNQSSQTPSAFGKFAQKIGQFVNAKLSQSMKLVSKTAKTIADWTIVPLYQKAISPVAKFAFEKCNVIGEKALNILVEWILKPAFKNIYDFAETIMKTGFGKEKSKVSDAAAIQNGENIFDQIEKVIIESCIGGGAVQGASTDCMHNVSITLLNGQIRNIQLHLEEVNLLLNIKKQFQVDNGTYTYYHNGNVQAERSAVEKKLAEAFKQ